MAVFNVCDSPLFMLLKYTKADLDVNCILIAVSDFLNFEFYGKYPNEKREGYIIAANNIIMTTMSKYI